MASTTVYGAVRTTTFSTTITAHPEWVSLTVSYPDPPITAPIQYTSLPSPADSASNYFSEPLPVLVLSEVDAVILNAAGSTFTTFTRAQAVPTNAIVVPSVAVACNTWACWSTSLRAGVAAGGAVAVLGILILASCAACCQCFGRKAHNEGEEGGSRRRSTSRGRKKNKGKQRENRSTEEEGIELESMPRPLTEEELMQLTGTSSESSAIPFPPLRRKSSEIRALRAYKAKRRDEMGDDLSEDCPVTCSESSVSHSGEEEEMERGRMRLREVESSRTRRENRREVHSIQSRQIRRPERVHMRQVRPWERSTAPLELHEENPFRSTKQVKPGT